MKKLVVLIVAIVLCAGMASAQQNPEKDASTSNSVLEGTGSPNAPEGTPDWFLAVNVTGTESWDLEGDASNDILSRMVGAGAVMTGIGWNVTITTVGASWLSEAVVSFADGAAAPGLYLTPGVGEGAPGSMTFDSGGILDLTDNAIPNIDVTTGDLQMEFFESFDDVADAVDAVWDSGVLDVAIMGGVPVPTVPPVAMLALAVLLIGLGTYFLKRRHSLG